MRDFCKLVVASSGSCGGAPALAEADVGLAIGTGTDVAMESADVVLMSGDLNGMPNAIGLSKATIRNIGQNLFWACAYNMLLIPVAAGALYPVTGTLLSPMMAAGATALFGIFVLDNAMRLKRFKAPVLPLVAGLPGPTVRLLRNWREPTTTTVAQKTPHISARVSRNFADLSHVMAVTSFE